MKQKRVGLKKKLFYGNIFWELLTRRSSIKVPAYQNSNAFEI